MKLLLCTFAVLLVSCKGDNAVQVAESRNQTDSVGELLEALHDRLTELFVENNEQIEALSAELHQLRQSLDDLSWVGHRIDRTVQSVAADNGALVRNVSRLTVQSDQIALNQEYCANHEALKNLFFELKPKCGHSESFDPNPQRVYASCAAAPPRSGVYRIAPNGTAEPIRVYCENEKFGGGWMVFQSRQDGSVNFNRSWDEYRNGFGRPGGEQWLGLELLNQLTGQVDHELLIVMENGTGFPVYENYPRFGVNSQSTNYTLRLPSTGSGSAGDSLYGYRGEKFVTYDQTSGSSYASCGNSLASGFWHYSCNQYSGRQNLNGVYGRQSGDRQGIWWASFTTAGEYSNILKRVQMMIRLPQ